MPSPDHSVDPVAALGISAVRMGILRVIVSADAPVTAAELMDEIKISRAALSLHTAALVDAGIVRQQVDPSRRDASSGFNRLVWSPIPERIEQMLGELSHQLQP